MGDILHNKWTIFSATAVYVGIVSGIFAIFGINGALQYGVYAFAGWVVILIVWIVYRRLVSRCALKEITLDNALKEYIPKSKEIKCIFSGGVRMQLFFDTYFNGNKVNTNLEVMMVIRYRKKRTAEYHKVMDIMRRISAILNRHGIRFSYKISSWDLFMVYGIIFNDNIAVVDFYYRKAGRTTRKSSELLLVDKRNGGYDKYLYETISEAFDTLWNYNE